MSIAILGIYITKGHIKDEVSRLGTELTKDYHDKNPVLVGVLKGSIIFIADLIRELDFPLEISFIALSSYKGTHSGVITQVYKESFEKYKSRHIIIVEDIIDTGRTILHLIDMIKAYNPLSIKLCALLDKPSKRVNTVKPDYVGFTIEDKFVVGYGLDFNEHYRNMPDIYLLHESPNRRIIK